MGIENVRSVAHPDPSGLPEEAYLAEHDDAAHPLDSGPMLEVHRDLMSWWTAERTKQATNRYQMAIDEDFYDGLQWNPEDVETLLERGQAPLVFNLVKPTADWIIGTQKRTQLDWKILPRRPDLSQTAEVKTSIMKYLSDVNHTNYAIGRAFKDAIVAGLGWIESGVRGDPEKEPIYAAYESWRNMIYDSSSKDRDLNEDCRYQFRWRWLDLDIGEALFPERKDVLHQAVINTSNLLTGGLDETGEEFWYLGQAIGGNDYTTMAFDRRSFVSDTSYVNYRRQRCRVIEGWYKKPMRVQMMRGSGPHDGQVFEENNPYHQADVVTARVSLFDSVLMKMHCAVFTEKALLWAGPSPYRHNRFPFVPIWCYRRGRDNATYGVIRQLRDAQEDYNKRASKALWILSSNRVVMEDGAVDDVEEARQEVARPDGMITVRPGKRFEVANDTQLANEQITLMDRDHMHIQSTSGVTDENMGRQTNATSGRAIEARQMQGTVITAEPFDNLRFARQIQGQNELSLAEQFMTQPRVIRLTGAKGKIDWVSINEPVENADGTVSFLNDVTSEQADYVVTDQDWHATQRQAMFEQMMEFLGKIPDPMLALKLLPHILGMSDIPDKDEFIAEIRQALGLPKPADEMTPEEQQAAQGQQQAQAAQQEMQAQAQQLALAEQQAGTELKQAQAEKALADAEKAKAEAEATAQGTAEGIQMLTQQVAHLVQMIQAMAHPANKPQETSPNGQEQNR
jgi:hypothetical protein